MNRSEDTKTAKCFDYARACFCFMIDLSSFRTHSMMASSCKKNITGAKRQKTSMHETKGSICKKYLEETFIEKMAVSFREKKSMQFDSEAYVLNDPFFCTVMGGFVESSEYVLTLKKEISNLKMKTKHNDLYKLKQSEDLGQCKNPCISNFVKLLYGDLLKWMQEITKIPLTAKVDVSGSCYSLTDHLLCHDDLLEDRRIAFIYYLTSDWSLDDGGTLDLFEAVNGEPGEIKESIVPELNKFVFFEVSPTSFHQVAEVKTENKRLAISGWFHGPAQPSVPHKEIMLFSSVSTLPIDITEWINPEYLDPGNQLDIREGFEDNSEVELANFLQPQKYQEICKALQDPEVAWEVKGPRTLRHCLTLNAATSPAVLQECQALFCSEAFLLVLSNLTGLSLHPACDEESDVSLGKICSSVRKWQNQCYTLLHDEVWKQGESLHAMMYFNCPEWDPINGGYTSFVSEGEEEPLLLVDPKPNSLALVFITEGTASFVKYVNCNAKNSSFNDIFNVYVESK